MISLDYLLSREWNSDIDADSIVIMTEIDIRYKVACGSFFMVVNKIDCSAPWGWIPLVDLAIAFGDIRDALACGGSASEMFEFTENEATIIFRRVDNSIAIKTSYVSCDETVSFYEFDREVTAFKSRVFQEAEVRFPSLVKNTSFRSLRNET